MSYLKDEENTGHTPRVLHMHVLENSDVGPHISGQLVSCKMNLVDDVYLELFVR